MKLISVVLVYVLPGAQVSATYSAKCEQVSYDLRASHRSTGNKRLVCCFEHGLLRQYFLVNFGSSPCRPPYNSNKLSKAKSRTGQGLEHGKQESLSLEI